MYEALAEVGRGSALNLAGALRARRRPDTTG